MNWWSRLFGDGTLTGVVEDIELTFGGAGNQWMTIGGERYATWIDYKSWPRIGRTVKHKPGKQHDGRGNMLRTTTILEMYD